MFYDTKSSTGLRPDFWQNYRLSELSSAEWEALCDGCGACCLHKFMDDEPKDTEYTNVACKLLDCATGQCKDYPNRKQYVPDCIRLTAEMMPTMMWLPRHCAYKRLYLGQGLPSWHYLVAGETAHAKGLAKVGVAGKVVSEVGISDEEIESRVIKWIKV